MHFEYFGLDLPPNEAKCNTSTLLAVIVRIKVINVPNVMCDIKADIAIYPKNDL